MPAVRHACDSCKILIGVPCDLKWSSCRARKKNSLSLMIGPPKVRPNWLNRTGGFATLFAFKKYWLASVASLRTYSHKLPCQALVPGFVTRLTVLPALLPYWADM